MEMNKVTIKIDGGTITVPLGYVTEDMNLAQIEDVVSKCISALEQRYKVFLEVDNAAEKDARFCAVQVHDRVVNPVLDTKLAEAVQKWRDAGNKRKAVAKKMDDISNEMDRVRAIRSEMLTLNENMVYGILPNGANQIPTRNADLYNAADRYMMKHTEYSVAISRLNMLIIEAVSL